MDNAFRDYYQRRLEVHNLLAEPAEGHLIEALEGAVGMPSPDPRAKEAVQDALAGARETAERLGLNLRPDAELVLLLLADEIVAKPVAAVTPEEAPELSGILRADAEALVANAEPSANEGEVSAHAVVDSLSRSWSDLQSARFRLWDNAGNNPAESFAGELKPSGELETEPDEDPAGGIA
jgi:hypothetical protein